MDIQHDEHVEPHDEHVEPHNDEHVAQSQDSSLKVGDYMYMYMLLCA